MAHALRQIAAWTTAARLVQHPERHIEYLLIDSRQLTHPERTLFFALPGSRTDGHTFIPSLYAAGVRAFVTARPLPDLPDADVLVVPDVRATLQTIVANHRAEYDLPVVGITGSNGKTIIKEWLTQLLLRTGHDVAYSPRSYNSQIGVPLSVWRIGSTHTVSVFEAGISRRGEMAALAAIIQPTLGLLTNIGEAHAVGFTDQHEKLTEKLLLFSGVDRLIYRSDTPWVTGTIQQLGLPGRSWATTAAADIRVVFRPAGAGRTHAELHWPDRSVVLDLPFTDAASCENAVHVACLLAELAALNDTTIRAFAQLQPVGLRLELMMGRAGTIVLNDSYSNDLTSLGQALNFAREQNRGLPITLILSDIPQSGHSRQTLYARTARLLTGRIDRLVGVGEEVTELRAHLPQTLPQTYFPTTTDLLAAWPALAFARSFILVKGARSFGFERIVARLQQRLHRTVLEVDLGALVHNYRTVRKRVASPTRIAAMVKAAAYGSGSLEVARRLEVEGVDYLVVAYPDEGVQLREGAITSPVLVLNVDAESFPLLHKYQLEPEIFDLAQLQALIGYTQAAAAPLLLHLKINTGMNRLGLEPADLAQAGRWLRDHPQLRVGSVLTHLAATDDPAEDAFTHIQVDRFLAAYAELSKWLGYRPLRHVLNTSGIARFPQYRYEMVRLGIGLYGMESSGHLTEQLQTVLHLRATVSQVRTVAPGETIGYSRHGKIQQPTRIATLSIGYADGLPRSAGYGRYAVRLRDAAAPTVGAICMDMCMVDVTAIEGVQAGDTVTVFGEQPTVGDLAAIDHTIDYEIISRIAERVPRRYIQE